MTRPFLPRARSGGLMLFLAIAAACTRPPGGPTPPPPPPPPPPDLATAPVIRSVTATLSRVEVDQDVTVSAVVEDAEKPLDQLIFQWSAPVGVFEGTGPAVRWRLPKQTSPTPVDVVVSLTVIDRYQVLESGQLLDREYRVTAQAPAVRVHDSPAELTKMVVTFLVDYFGNSAVSPEACVVDFLDSCPGKAAELEDIEGNRDDFRILSAAAAVTNITFDSATSATVVAHCEFRDQDRESGRQGHAVGDCVLTARYDTRRWWLCSSHFFPDSGSGAMYTHYRRRGRVVRPPRS